MDFDVDINPCIRKEQFSGCLIGQCLGDALGFPVEGHSRKICRQYVKENLGKERAGKIGRAPFAFGQYTDDSQLARELLQSYVSCKRFDSEDYAGRIAAIFSEERIVGRGRATEEAANRLIRGVPWEDAGTPAPSAGNGSAMRVGPIGLIFYDNPQQLIQAAQHQGRITHQDKRCSAGAVAIAGAVTMSLRSKEINTERFLSQLSKWTQPIEPTVTSAIKKLINWVSLPPEEAAIFISRAGLPPEFQNEWQGISPFVIGSVLWSLYSFLRTPKDYWKTICTAIEVGGDVDTTAAMAGAISGAYLGLEALPLNLAYCLTDQGSWGFNELKELAHHSYEVKMQQQMRQND